jgi:capsular exopolysaccharide synthesis family protein
VTGAELTMLAGLVAAAAAFALIALRPRFGAYLYLTASPLVVGIARGAMVPILRPNEVLLVLIVAALAMSMLARQCKVPSFGRVELALFLLAATSSVIPLLLRFGRDFPLSSDDILYSTVFWKYLLLFMVFRTSISTPSQVACCLHLSMVSAMAVMIIAVLQVENLFGIPEFLHSYYDQPFEGHKTIVTERGTSTVASAFGFGDLMIMNLVAALALVRPGRSGHWLYVAASVCFVGGCIVAGEFSGYIGLGVAMLAYGIVSGRLSRLLIIGIPAAVVASAFFWPVIDKRLAGFEGPSGLPHSWNGRWENLQRFFFPELFSNLNWLLGVRLTPRLPAPETWRQWVYIESGYVWLLWIGGLPLVAAFIFFVVVSAAALRRVIRERTDAVGVAAMAGFTYLIVVVVLMLVDPHLTGRGSADLFFPLLALSLVPRRRTGKSGNAILLRTGRLVEGALGLPNFGLVPIIQHMERKQTPHQYLLDKPNSVYAKAIKCIFMRLHFAQFGAESRVVLVTSTLPGEGKTTLAMSLAASAAQSGHKTIVVDLDLRHPAVGREMGKPVETDLLDYIIGERSLDEIIHKDPGETNLHFVPVKGKTAPPADLLYSPAMKSLLAELRLRYEYIILDTSPAFGFGDAHVTSLLADAVLFVMQWEKTSEEVAANGLDVLRKTNVPVIGTAVTQVDVRRHVYYGQSDVYQHNRKYKKYFRNYPGAFIRSP